ncbi:hypothetical protein BDC45DRAFT_517288 [Circinella umbellata]|nr:hypothetical protein BDC45DRAFT_517288 [Circinella umbellata]
MLGSNVTKKNHYSSLFFLFFILITYRILHTLYLDNMARIYSLQYCLLFVAMASVMINNNFSVFAQEKIPCRETDGSCPDDLSCNWNFNDPINSYCE